LTLVAAGWGGSRRFEPETAAAVGTRDLWVLGGGELLRSTDAGRHFVRVASPPFPAHGTVPTLVFASARDGYAYVPFSGRLYATHDGGESWTGAGLAGGVRALAVAGGYAYAVFGGRRYARTPVDRNAWRTAPLPFPVSAGPVGLGAHGPHVWVLGNGPSRQPQLHSRLARSDDAGLRFEAARSPCYPGLGGRLQPASASVVWVTCPSGMMAAAFRSTNGGRTWRNLPTPALTNGAMLAPVSTRDAVLARVVEAPLLRTTDGGRTWRRVRQPARVLGIGWIAFSTGGVGAALVNTGPSIVQLWRTRDAGATWRNVPLR
jgi:photosystem II stability/assembly factor-like uncharacterized protein